jgi:Fur family peroxide stress response transcriptional regulator
MSPTEKQQRIDRFFAAHRERGLPVTTQRRAVFEAILDRRDHPTAEQVYRAVLGELPQISRMTVHRILGTFVSLGLLSKTCHPGSSARFDPKLHQHHHLVCLDCGDIIDFEDARLNKLPWPDVGRHGFQIQDYHIHFRGRCARCRQKPQAFGAGRKTAPRLQIQRNKPKLKLKGTSA